MFPFTINEQLDVWRAICGPVDIGEFITSPFRSDNIPKCFLSEYNGIITFKDFAFPKYNKYTCIHAISHLKNISYMHSISYITKMLTYNKNVSVNINNQVIRSGRKIDTSGDKQIWWEPFLYKNEPSFTNKDVDYWKIRGVKKDQLVNDNVFSLHHYYIITDSYKRRYFPEEYPCYAYYFPDSGNSKLYFPMRKENRFISTAKKNDVWRWESFPPSENFIITKSYKDGRMLKNIYPDIDIYAFQNEGVIPDDIHLLTLKRNGIILYDNDEPGINASNTLAEILLKDHDKVISASFDKKFGKDVDEVYLNYGENVIKELINPLLCQIR